MGQELKQVPSRFPVLADLDASSCPAFLSSSGHLSTRITHPRILPQVLLLATPVTQHGRNRFWVGSEGDKRGGRDVGKSEVAIVCEQGSSAEDL